MGASPEDALRPAAVAVDVSPVPSMSSSLASAADNSDADVYYHMVRGQHDKVFVLASAQVLQLSMVVYCCHLNALPAWQLRFHS
jgi:hypothetical protein